ncbi:MAG TPA: non-reducing end alpha-L-arabinofuranosidase family hydrolase, partial [Polyangiales bacterium]
MDELAEDSGNVMAGGSRDASTEPGRRPDGAVPLDAGAGSSKADAAPAEGESPDGSLPGMDDAGSQTGPDVTCELPSTFKWKGGAPLAQPKNGWLSMKDATYVFHNGQHILYFTTFQDNWGSGMMTFKDWPDAANAPQTPTKFGVAPTLFYFTPKKVWVMAYQWGPHKFSYRTSSDPSDPNGWSGEKSLYNTALPPNGTGPIDQTVICDSARCYLYYAGDNGHIYKSS